MNFLFVFPPLCLPVNPYISVPLLSTILRNSGYFVDSLDLNLEFYKECIFAPTSLVSSYERLKKIYKSISNNTFSFADKNEEYYIKKNFTNISRLINTEYNKIENTINNIKRAVDTLKSQTDFYDIDKNYESIRIVNDALNIYLSSFFVNDKLNKKIGLKYKTLKYFVENSKLNPFYDYFLNKIKNGYFDKYDCIFISQPYDIQQFATYTLAYLLKKHTKINTTY